jgi:putative hemolysin
MGVNERFEVFFDELGLKCSDGELRVIRARNRSAHGGGIGDPQEALRLSRAYRVLLNRALLQVLGHDGAYIDYSVLGFPEKPLREPSGGVAGAG